MIVRAVTAKRISWLAFTELDANDELGDPTRSQTVLEVLLIDVNFIICTWSIVFVELPIELAGHECARLFILQFQLPIGDYKQLSDVITVTDQGIIILSRYSVHYQSRLC